MGRITVLPAVLANRIAAGEVVERPASVVKELVENAIDAGAGRVTVGVQDGGRERIVVRDDGEGMSREDAALAFARHATSKITRLEDLEGIASFGFRGEALASIAAAADVDLLTRRAADDTGTCVRARGGSIVEIADAGGPPGTQVDVHALLADLPARRKFLRQGATEFAHIAEVVSRIALSVPRVGFTLTHGDREALSFPPVAGPADRIVQVIGRDASAGVLHLEAKSPTLSLEAYLGRPEHSLSSARLVLTYVNGRFVRDRVLTRAVLDGYESVLMRGRYPVAIVFLQLRPGEVDVNVHPAKAEVRFRDSGQVHRLVAGGIAARLRDRGVQGPHVRGGGPPATQQGSPPGPGSYEAPGPVGSRTRASADPSLGAGTPWLREGRRPYGPRADEASGRGLPETSTTAAYAAALVTPAVGFFGALKFLGQILDGYLVCASERGLVLIDQHAAHERVRFEDLRAQLAAGGVAVQRLLVPETLTVGLTGVQALVEAREPLARLGFEGEPFGEGIYLLRAVPAMLVDADCGAILRDVAAECADGAMGRAVDGAVETLLASIACHSAVRIGRTLERAQAEGLLREMDRIELASYCPHGRPAFVEIDGGALERMFKR
jgi:DNA mismatch repair protein MutL